MSFAMDIRLKKSSKIYCQGDVMYGLLQFQSKSEIRHEGIYLYLEGIVNLQLSSKTFGIFEAFYNSVKVAVKGATELRDRQERNRLFGVRNLLEDGFTDKFRLISLRQPITLMSYQTEVAKAGRLPAGVVEIPFEFRIEPNGSAKKLFETYHGVFVNIQYLLRCEMRRGMLSKDVLKTIEFIVQYPEHDVDRALVKPVEFTITPESLRAAKDRDRIPNFLIKGKIDSIVCSLEKPFTGEITITKCEAPIRSIELQLVRVETCGCAEGYAKEATEVQNIRIGEGDVLRGASIPIYMIFPRLFSCPTVAAPSFKVEFEVNIVVVLKDEHVITENFPIRLTRS